MGDCRYRGGVGTQGTLREAGPLYDIITELRKKNPCTKIRETGFSEPYLITESEDQIIDEMLALLNKNGLTSYKALSLLERLGNIIEMGQRLAKGTTH